MRAFDPMCRVAVFVLAIAVGFAAARPAAAARADATWRLEDLSGLVSVAAHDACLAMKAGGELPNDVTVVTRGDGRVTLTRGNESIALSPSTRLTVHSGGPNETRVVQQTGLAWFKVRKERRPHFSVETPDLTATVRGTTFTVAVGMSGAGVHVREGEVEVATSWRDAVTLVRAGTLARVTRAERDRIALINGGNVTRIVSGIDGRLGPAGLRRASTGAGDLFGGGAGAGILSAAAPAGRTLAAELRLSTGPDIRTDGATSRVLPVAHGDVRMDPLEKPGAKHRRHGLPLIETILSAIVLLVLIIVHTVWGRVRRTRSAPATSAQG